MKTIKAILVILLAAAFVLMNISTAKALPPLPSSFYGTVTIDGSNAPVGTEVSAWINGVKYAYTSTTESGGETVYSLDVPGDDPAQAGVQGGVEGDTIVFIIGSLVVAQTGTWHSGTNVQLNLTATANDPPTDISLSNNTVAENEPITTLVGTLSTTDPDQGDTFTYTFVSGAGDTDNSSFSISESNLRTNAVFNYEAKPSYSIRVRTTDQGGQFYDESFTINVTNVNETPTDIALSNNSVAENAAANTVVGAFSTTDPDAGGTFTYTFVSGAGDTDNASFNIDNSNLRINAPFNFEEKTSYSIRVRTTDQGGLFYDESFTINVTNVNETPTDIALSNNSVAENAAANTVVGAFSTTDPDADGTFTYTFVSGAGDTDNASFNIDNSNLRINAPFNFEAKTSYSIRVRSTDQGGLFYDESFTINVTNVNENPTDIALSNNSVPENASSGTAVGTLSATDPDDGTTFSFTLVAGTGGDDNASFNIAGNELRTNAVFNYEAKSSYSIRVRVTDQGGLPYDEIFLISVTNVNEAPTDLSVTPSSVAENAVVNTVVGSFAAVDPDAGNTFTYTLVSGDGDTDNASFNISSGNLRTSAIFDYEAKSSYSIRVQASDQGGLPFQKVLTITIVNVNETPTDIALSNNSVAENAAANTVVGAFSTTDPDADGTFTYTFVSGAGDTDNASFNIDNSNLRINAPFNFEAKTSYSIRVRTTDQGGSFYDESFTINVTDVNEAPTDIILTPSSVAENSSAGTLVGELSTTDPDTGNTFTYALVAGIGDADNAAFTISESNLITAAVFNFEAKPSYSIRVRSTDQSGTLYFEKALTVNVTDVNEQPFDISLSSNTVAENAAAGALVGVLSTSDPEGGTSFTYELVAGIGSTDNASFTFTGNELHTAAVFDYEVKNSLSIRVRTTDSGGYSYEEVLTVFVTNVNEAPTDITLADNNVNENSVINTEVGMFSTTDPDTGNTFTYALVAGAGDTGNSSFNISGNRLRTSVVFNFEVQSSYSIRVQVTDQGGLSYEKIFSINIANINEAPTNISLIPSSVAENLPINSVVGPLSTTDPDAGNTFTYSFVSGEGSTDNSSFNLSGGNLRTSGVFNFEAKNSYSVRIKTTDQGGLTFEKAITVNITDVNEAPTAAADTYSTLKNQLLTVAASGVLANDTDPDIPHTLTAVLVTNIPAGQGTLSLSSNGGFTYNPPANWAGQTSFTYKANDGLLDSNTVTVTINVNETNQAPTNISLSASSVAENLAVNTNIGTLTTTDPDIADSFTYTLVSGTGSSDNASFNISGSILRTSTVFNYEVKSSYSIRVRSTDQGGLWIEKAFTISVINVNEAPVLGAIGNKNVDELTELTFTAAATDPDVPVNTLTYSLVSAPSGANIHSISGIFTWTPTEAQGPGPGPYLFTVSVCDNGTPQLCDQESITVTVEEVNTIPVGNTDSFVVGMNEILTVDVPGVLINDTDSDIPPNVLSAIWHSDPTHGELDFFTDGHFVYTPEPDWAGVDTFTYQVFDGEYYSDPVTVQITVTELPQIYLYLPLILK